MGYSVKSCFSFDGASELYKNHKFDLVLCDYNMPGKSGVDFYHDVFDKGSIPFLMLTGSVISTENKLMSLKEESDFYFVEKPFSEESLKNLITKLI
jgi:DNA-binding response OmpR family regulator